MTEFQELVKDAPKYASMERGELVAYAYAMYATGQKMEADNAKLLELVRNLLRVIPRDVSGVVIGAHGEHPTYYSFADAMRELGIEVDE